MVGDKNKKDKRQQNWVKLEASLAPAEAEVGAVAMADQKASAGARGARLIFLQSTNLQYHLETS